MQSHFNALLVIYFHNQFSGYTTMNLVKFHAVLQTTVCSLLDMRVQLIGSRRSTGLRAVKRCSVVYKRERDERQN
jgi:hypothetical protein